MQLAHIPGIPAFFIHNGAPQALVGCHENSMAGCGVMQLAHIPGIPAFFIHNGAPEAPVGCYDIKLCPLDLADAVAFGLRFDGHKRVHNADEHIAAIAAERSSAI